MTGCLGLVWKWLRRKQPGFGKIPDHFRPELQSSRFFHRHSDLQLGHSGSEQERSGIEGDHSDSEPDYSEALLGCSTKKLGRFRFERE